MESRYFDFYRTHLSWRTSRKSHELQHPLYQQQTAVDEGGLPSHMGPHKSTIARTRHGMASLNPESKLVVAPPRAFLDAWTQTSKYLESEQRYLFRDSQFEPDKKRSASATFPIHGQIPSLHLHQLHPTGSISFLLVLLALLLPAPYGSPKTLLGLPLPKHPSTLDLMLYSTPE